MNTINLPPWAQTVLSALGFLSLFAPQIVHLCGLQDSPAGKVITQLGNNVVGLVKDLKSEKEVP